MKASPRKQTIAATTNHVDAGLKGTACRNKKHATL
jgi:hypothetical protein